MVCPGRPRLAVGEVMKIIRPDRAAIMPRIAVLAARKPTEPPQVSALKKYAQDNHGVSINVKVSPQYYLITVPGASLAGKFRVETAHIIEECHLDKRLVIHVGH